MNQFIRISSILLLTLAIPTPSQAFDAEAETLVDRYRDLTEYPDNYTITYDQISLYGDGSFEVVGGTETLAILKPSPFNSATPAILQANLDFYSWAVGKFVTKNDLDATKSGFRINDQFTAGASYFGPALWYAVGIDAPASAQIDATTKKISKLLAQFKKQARSKKFGSLAQKILKQLEGLSDDLCASVASENAGAPPVKWCAADIQQVEVMESLVERAAKSKSTNKRLKNVNKTRSLVRKLGKGCEL